MDDREDKKGGQAAWIPDPDEEDILYCADYSSDMEELLKTDDANGRKEASTSSKATTDEQAMVSSLTQPIVKVLGELFSREDKKSIPPFKGKSTDKLITEWLKGAEHVARNNDWDDNQKLRFFSDRLKGEALEWHGEYSEEQGEELNYGDWREAIIERFQDAFDLATLKKKLLKLKQKPEENCRAFVSRLNSLYDSIEGKKDKLDQDKTTIVKDQLLSKQQRTDTKPEGHIATNDKPDHHTQGSDSNNAETTAEKQLIRVAEKLVSQGAETAAHTEEITTTHQTYEKAQRQEKVSLPTQTDQDSIVYDNNTRARPIIRRTGLTTNPTQFPDIKINHNHSGKIKQTTFNQDPSNHPTIKGHQEIGKSFATSATKKGI
ncbi:hypothetical protein OUZ56_005583 [Daphnia magna]|uniref:Ty3 transposon capsid-like protein domain-containing protein n=1 Tax=Daphnia magna TaxID=35525 RepID=A0ABQ9YT70_9CRUS|nr:hypothetical protein OUZ56_005583 [Daphnia magna]